MQRTFRASKRERERRNKILKPFVHWTIIQLLSIGFYWMVRNETMENLNLRVCLCVCVSAIIFTCLHSTILCSTYFFIYIWSDPISRASCIPMKLMLYATSIHVMWIAMWMHLVSSNKYRLWLHWNCGATTCNVKL